MNDSRQLPGWYGKLPGAGDFVSRRLGGETIRWWANWLERSLQYQNEHHPGWQSRYVRAPLWNFLIPASTAADQPQLGCVAPSCDRVGRCYPLCLLQPLAPSVNTDPSAETEALRDACKELGRIGYQILDGIRRGISPESFDQTLAMTLPELADTQGHPWPELAHYLRATDMTSFWWTHPASGSAMRRHVHHGALNHMLFNHLFASPAGEADR